MSEDKHAGATPAGAVEATTSDGADARDRAIGAAAADLADRLMALADQLAATTPPQRVRYGKGRLGSSLKRRSPAGFVLDSANLQMLLPDGRLWSYSRSDAVRYPAGRYFDVRADYANFARGRSFFGGRGFAFLGAVLGKYTFGMADQDGADGPGALCAISGEGSSVRYVDAGAALAAIADSVTASRDRGDR